MPDGHFVRRTTHGHRNVTARLANKLCPPSIMVISKLLCRAIAKRVIIEVDFHMDKFVSAAALAAAIIFGGFAGSQVAGQPEPPLNVAEESVTALDWTYCAKTDNPAVCNAMGHPYFMPEATYAVKARGVRFYARACDLANTPDSAENCVVAGKAVALGVLDHYEAVSPEYRVDPAKGRALFERGCQLGNVNSCGYLGDFQQRGVGGPMDQAAAMKSFMAGCTIDKSKSERHTSTQACLQLGLATVRGIGTEPNFAAGTEYLYNSCEPQKKYGSKFQGAACLELGKASEQGLYGQAIDINLALNLYTDACLKASKEGCAMREKATANPNNAATVAVIDRKNASAAEAEAAAYAKSSAALKAAAAVPVKVRPTCEALATQGVTVLDDYKRAADKLMAYADKAMASTNDKNELRNLNIDFTRNTDIISENACNSLLDIRDEANLACTGTMWTEMRESSLRHAQTAAASISGEFNTNNRCRTRLRF